MYITDLITMEHSQHSQDNMKTLYENETIKIVEINGQWIKINK